MPSYSDRVAARQGASAIRQQVEAIYANRGLPAPDNIDAWVNRVQRQGAGALDSARMWADRLAPNGFVGGAEQPFLQPAPTQDETRFTSPGQLSPGSQPGNYVPPAAKVDYRGMAAALLPWLPSELLDIYSQAWAEFGDQQVALGKVRQSPVYDTYFEGNRRENGSLRYSEMEYFAIKEAMLDELDDYGLNSDLYESKIGQIIGGDVSPQEFGARLNVMWERIVNATPEEKAAAAQEFGVGNMSDEAFLGVAVDPQIGQEVLDRRISIAQITGRANRFGFARSRGRVEELMAAGLSPEVASQFFGQAAAAVPRLGGYAARFNEGEFNIEDFEEAGLFGDVGEQQRVSRLQRREASLFSPGASVRQDQSGDLVGLQQR